MTSKTLLAIRYQVFCTATLLVLTWPQLIPAQTVRPIEVELSFQDRALGVSARFPKLAEDEVQFELAHWAGVRDFHKNISLLKAVDNENNPLQVDVVSDGVWRVQSNKRPFELSYLVSHEKPTFTVGRTEHFQPSLFQDWAFLWGQSYLLVPQNHRYQDRPVEVSIKPGSYQSTWPSWASDGKLNSFHELADSLLIAGDFRISEIELEATKVRIAIRGDWKFTDERAIATIEKVIRAQARYMQTPPKQDLLIALVPGSVNSFGGTVVGGAIGMYPSPEEDLTADGSTALHLVAHEHFHLWNGQILKPKRGKREGYYKWMQEGCTDYYAYLTLYREELLSDSKMLDVFNGLLIKLAENPYTETATASVLAKNYWTNRHYSRLPYVKGALISLLIDLKIRNATSGQKSIDDFLRGLMRNGSDGMNRYSQSRVVDVLNQVARGETDWEAFVEKYTIQADALPLEAVLNQNGFDTHVVFKKVFELGLEVDGTRIGTGSRITSVKKGSAAETAGLKIDDIISGVSIHFGDVDKVAKFKITRGDEMLDVEFVPARTCNVLQIINSEQNRKRLQKLLR